MDITLRGITLNTQFDADATCRDAHYFDNISLSVQKENQEQKAELIRKKDPHFIFLQETELGSLRTDFRIQPIDLARILEKMGLKYYVQYGSCTELDERKHRLLGKIVRKVYGLEIAQQFFKKKRIETGQIPDEDVVLHFGNAILSRFPLEVVKHKFYFPPSPLDAVTFLKIVARMDERKSYLLCRTRIPGTDRPLYLLNTHFENKELENRRAQSKILYDDFYDFIGEDFFAGGDFNAEPLGPDYDLESKVDDESFERLARHPNMHCFKGIYPDSYVNRHANQEFTTHLHKGKPRTYDSFLIPITWEFSGYEVCGGVSDHKAVVAEFTKTPVH